MPRQKLLPRKPVSSLFSFSTDCVATNLQIYADSLQYLPPYVKETILRKILRSRKSCNHLPVSKALSLLIHPSLKSIDLSSVNVDDETLNILKECTALTNINLRNCDNQNFSSATLLDLCRRITKLVVLDVAGCRQFTDSVFECVAMKCTNLCELCCEGCNVTDKGLAHLAEYNKKINCLRISNTNITGDGITDAVKNKNWRSLRELRIDNCTKVNDDVLKTVIENCPKLEILTFYNCAITDETSIFQDITKTCKKLKQLHWTISW